MKIFVGIFVAICLASGVSAILDEATCRSVIEDPSFSFEEFMGNQYKYEAGSVNSDAKDFVKAFDATIKVDDTWYATFTANLKDNNQINNDYVITEQDGAKIRQSLLEDGVVTEKEYIITVYGYKPFAWAQFNVCSANNDGSDIRFVVSFASYKMTPADYRKVIQNDKNNKFPGFLVKVGTGSRISDQGQ